MTYEDDLAKDSGLTPAQRKEHLRKIREQWRQMPPDPFAGVDAGIAKDKSLAVNPLPHIAPWRPLIPKERMDEIADKIFGPNRIPRAKPWDYDP